jgi:probable F420-dependent oxidoreductase
MYLDTRIGGDLSDASDRAGQAESAGYQGVWTSETGHDPFLPLALAARSTEHVQLGTAVAIAFARTPMTTAYVAWDCNAVSHGRFILGLGSQIKAHIEKRYSMAWSHPAARMREYIAALRAIWDAWQNGAKLSFRGDFYTHTLMTPMFSPRANDFGPPKVFLAAVGAGMLRVASESADGLVVHPFVTERYLNEVIVPVVDSGLATSGRSRDAFQIMVLPLVVTGRTEGERQAADTAVRKQLAFYGSTPAYRDVLELHGWGALQEELHDMSLRGLWDEMSTLIDDKVLEALAVVGEPDQIGSLVAARYGGIADRFMPNFMSLGSAVSDEIVRSWQAAS